MPLKRRGSLHICIIKLTFYAKKNYGPNKLSEWKQHAQNNRLLSYLCPGDLY